MESHFPGKTDFPGETGKVLLNMAYSKVDFLQSTTLNRFSEHVTSHIDILRKLWATCLAAVRDHSTDVLKLAADVITDFSVSTFHVKYELSTMDIDNPGINFPPSKDCWQQLPSDRNMVSRTIRIGLEESSKV